MASRAALARFEGLHYRAGRPSACVLALGAWATLEGRRDLAGVLIVTMPTLHAGWRRGVWPDLCDAGVSWGERAARVNASLRTISRVIVDPRWRGVGVASALVRAYLRSPLTERTEAAAAMGSVSGFFEGGGMKRAGLVRSERDARFARAIAGMGVGAWMLIDLDRGARLLAKKPGLRRAVAAWAKSSAATRRHWERFGRTRTREFAAWAGAGCLAERRVYVFERGLESGGASWRRKQCAA